uniref:G_PROTEIN_RECEP_F1_2 domain-containing protein n=1 Tax=Meloidogyne hapla TaxID=6305 RepID=A0A1I8BHF4_MELHA
YYMLRTTIAMVTQTIGPIFLITFLTAITEYKLAISLKARRTLFEAQNRNRSIVALEELKEKVSRTVSIFIAIKFLILRSLPIFFDIYETFYGIDSFGIILSILVRLSDFGVVLNSATNSFAYFGKTEFFANRLKSKLLKERQHIMVAKAASACLITGISPKYLPKQIISYNQINKGLNLSDIVRRRNQRKTLSYFSRDSLNNSLSTSPTGTPLIRSSHFLSLRNGTSSVVHKHPLIKRLESPLAINNLKINKEEIINIEICNNLTKTNCLIELIENKEEEKQQNNLNN